MRAAAIAKCWTFVSSRGDRRYQALLYADGTASGDCPGWCRRVAADGSRTCRHTRSILMGTADRECEGAHDYRPRSGAGAGAGAIATMPATRPADTFGRMGRRRIHLAR